MNREFIDVTPSKKGRGSTILVPNDEYKTYLQRDTGQFADREFAAYPAGSDAAIPEQFLKYHNDLFSYGANSLARTITHSGQNAYLFYSPMRKKGNGRSSVHITAKNSPADWEQDGSMRAHNSISPIIPISPIRNTALSCRARGRLNSPTPSAKIVT